MRARQLWVGILLILVGTLVLMSNLGFLTWDFWGALRQLWPVLLISIGLTMLLAETRWVFLGLLLLIAAVLFTALNPMGFLPLNYNLPGVRGHMRQSAFYSRMWDASIAQGELGLKVPAGTINLIGSADQLVSGRIWYRGGTPIWEYRQRAETAVVTLSSGKMGRWLRGSQGYEGSIALGVMVPWEIHLELGAGKLSGDLRSVPITKLTAEIGAGSMDLTLPAKDIRGGVDIKAGASSVRLRIPQGVGLRVHLSNPIGRHNLDALGLRRMGDYWVSDDYETVPSAYDVTVSLGVGRLEMEYISPLPQI
ncbi:MAG: hypothetical protein GX341_00720 [Firmicutes bacterium]|nr:hypothetical protein [Bacillota bacterium]